VTNKRGNDESVVALPLSGDSFVVHLLLWPLISAAALMLVMPAASLAATVERFWFRRIDHVAEVEVQLRGPATRWHLHTHGQELWIDLEHAQVPASVREVSVPVVFPLAGVSLRDFGEWVRLVIRVRGEVDYVVAQMPQALVVRIAPSGQAVDLAQSLILEMQRSRHWSTGLAPPTSRLEHASRDRELRPVDNGLRIAGEATRSPDQPGVTHSAVSNSGGGPSPSLRRAPLLAYAGETTHSAQVMAKTVQPVAQHGRPPLGVGQEGAPPMVAIDAGHGGLDPGTESASGIAEKTIALAIARRLAAALESRGIPAELTRDDDRFLRLGERTELANHAHADLFVSIHLNSSPDWSVSGIETYYLNNTTDRATIRLARMENGEGYSASGQSDLNYILTNLQQDYKAHESSSLARMIEAETATNVDNALGIRVNALGAKMGPFYVLVGAEMPSVLVECGFLSNAREAQLLVQPSYQEALAEGIAAAIMHYFNADVAVGNL
jgi:N-acetylmuramoyl-L-alanine amidase